MGRLTSNWLILSLWLLFVAAKDPRLNEAGEVEVSQAEDKAVQEEAIVEAAEAENDLMEIQASTTHYSFYSRPQPSRPPKLLPPQVSLRVPKLFLWFSFVSVRLSQKK